jgi:hypothetical protein
MHQPSSVGLQMGHHPTGGGTNLNNGDHTNESYAASSGMHLPPVHYPSPYMEEGGPVPHQPLREIEPQFRLAPEEYNNDENVETEGDSEEEPVKLFVGQVRHL